MIKRNFLRIVVVSMGVVAIVAGVRFSSGGAKKPMYNSYLSEAAAVSPKEVNSPTSTGMLILPVSTSSNHKIQMIDVEYAENFSNDRILVGASHNIFVGKVVVQVGSKGRGFGPETQFSVEVISNIKGNLQGIVTVDQFGGYKNGVLYVVEDGAPLLQPGATYLLSTRYNNQGNWYTLNSFPTASEMISQNSSLADAQLQALASRDSRVRQLESAYSVEIPLGADIKNNNVRNSYQSLQTASLSSTSTSSSSSPNTN